MADTIGDRIGRARRRCGLTGTELARRIGISKQHLSAIEHSHIIDPGTVVTAKIAEELNVSGDYLLSGRLTPRRPFAKLAEAIV